MQVVPLITPFYLFMFVVNHCDMLRLICWVLIGFSSIVYPPTLQTDELLGRFAIDVPGFEKLIFYYDHVPIMLLFNYCS
jgi:hypothetical protein